MELNHSRDRISSAPNEIVHYILQQLNHSELGNAMQAGRKLLAVGQNIAFEKLHCDLPTSGAAADLKYGFKFSSQEASTLIAKLQHACKILSRPELAARVRHLHFGLVIGGSVEPQDLLVHADVYRTILQYLPNVENVKSLRFDMFVDDMPFSLIRSFRNLQTLRIPGVWVQQTPGLQIRHLIVERRKLGWDRSDQNEQHFQRNLSTVKELLRLTSLTLLFHIGSSNDSTPYYDYSSLRTLKSLIVRGSTKFGGYHEDDFDNTPCGISKAVTDVSFQGSFWMKSPHIWLSSFASTVRRLELTGVSTANNAINVVFPELTTLEYHWCSPQLLNGAQFPSLKYYSESLGLGPNVTTNQNFRTPLSVVRGLVNQLRIIVLRGEYSEFRRGTRALLNIDEVITQINSAKKDGHLRAAFIEGSFALPSTEAQPWFKCLGPMDYSDVQGRFKARMSMLKEVDPERQFTETRNNVTTHLGGVVDNIPWDACF